MFTSNTAKIVFYAVLIAILIGISAFIIGRRREKQDQLTQLPSDTDWGKALTNDENKRIASITSQLYNDMKGLNIFTRDEKPYQEMTILSDKLLVAVANYYKQKHCTGSETLVSWLKDESFHWYSFSLQTTVNNIVKRLNTLGVN